MQSVFWWDGYNKVAFDLADARSAYKALVKKHPVVRGGTKQKLIYDDLGQPTSTVRRTYARRPHISEGPEGPSADYDFLAGDRRIRPDKAHEVFNQEALMNVPREPGPIMTGGGYQSQPHKLLESYGLPKDILPKSPAAKEMSNRILHFHEGFESDALPSKSTAWDSLRAWGGRPEGLNTGHVSPSVILNENNLVSTLPKDLHSELHPMLKTVRNEADKSWPVIQKLLKRDIPYGEGRFSRHAKKRMEEAMYNNKPRAQIMSDIVDGNTLS